MITYRLFAVVCYGDAHFTGVWQNNDGSCWGYDGRTHGGRPKQLQSVNLTTLREYAGHDILLTLYCLDRSTEGVDQ